MKKSNKKGFTIVELVIVIAVIAILAAVLIPVFSGVVRKANKSKDTQLVRNLNQALATDLNEHNTMYDALLAAKEFGYDVDKINASATGNLILWDSVNDCFVYLNDGEYEYIPDTKVEEPELHDYWMIVKEVVDSDYSLYAGEGFTATNNQVVVENGFDVGDNTGLNVTVKGQNKTLTVRAATVADVVTINAKGSVINFYGTAGQVDVIEVAKDSLHIYGEVEFVSVSNGRVYVEANATVKGIHAETEDAIVEINTQATVEAVTKEPNVSATIKRGEVELEDVEEISKETAQAGAKLFNGGNGSAELPFVITSATQFTNIEKVDLEQAFFVVENDIDFTETIVNDYYYINAKENQIISIDLNGKTLNNVSAYIFGYASNLKLFNGKIIFDGNAGVVEDTYKTVIDMQFSDLVLDGNLEVTNSHYGALVAYAFLRDTYDTVFSASNVTANFNLVNTGSNAYTGSLFGYIGGSKITATVTNCVLNGSLQSPQNASGFVGACSSGSITSSGNKVNGIVIASGSVNNFGGNGTVSAANDGLVALGATAQVVKVATADLFDQSVEYGTEIVINHQNEDVAYYLVSIEYWVNSLIDGSGGYPRPIQVRIDVTENGAYETGLYKNKFVQLEEEREGAPTYERNGAKIWLEGNTYYVYDNNYVFGGMCCLRAYGYNSAGTLVVVENATYWVK